MENMSETQPEPTLKGQDAVDLWLQGAEAWNDWVRENEICGHIHFYGTDFSDIQTRHEINVLSFEEYHFPENRVIFENVSFGTGDVSFKGVHFRRGVAFINAAFDGGLISFENTHFGVGGVDFNYIDFGDGGIDFSFANLGEGMVHFVDCVFDDGEISFYGATANKGRFVLERVTSRATIDFFHLLEAENLFDLSFFKSTLEKSVILPTSALRCIPDFRFCRLDAPVSLHHVKLKPIREIADSAVEFLDEIVEDPAEVTILRRLSELAKENHDHRSFLTFRSAERHFRRAIYPHRLSSIGSLLFKVASNDGQSLIRPAVGLIITFLVFSILFIDSGTDPMEAITQSIANSLPFLPASWQIPLTLTNLLQQGLSTFFLFLLGLGILNRIRS